MKKITIAVSMISLLAASASAQPGNGAGFRAAAKERFQAYDINGDGAVSYDELMEDVGRKFAEFDQDGNGILLLDELPLKMPLPAHAAERIARKQERMQRHQSRASENPEEAQPRLSPEEMAEKRRPSRMKFMAKLDRDENEQLDIDEFAAPLIKRYKRADINGDGTVSEAELDESFERGQRRMHRRGMRHARGQ